MPHNIPDWTDRTPNRELAVPRRPVKARVVPEWNGALAGRSLKAASKRTTQRLRSSPILRVVNGVSPAPARSRFQLHGRRNLQPEQHPDTAHNGSRHVLRDQRHCDGIGRGPHGPQLFGNHHGIWRHRQCRGQRFGECDQEFVRCGMRFEANCDCPLSPAFDSPTSQLLFGGRGLGGRSLLSSGTQRSIIVNPLIRPPATFSPDLGGEGTMVRSPPIPATPMTIPVSRRSP